MVGACLSSKVPAIIVLIVGLIGNIIGVGTIGALNYILIILMLLITMCIKPPKENDEYKDEQMQISKHIFFSIILVMVAKLILTKFTIGDLLLHITLAVLSVIFYKIFVNSLVVIQEITDRRAFSIEEIIGASLLVSIACSAFGNLSIFGLSIRNVLSIFMVLLLGWRNGVLIGTTAGVTIGVTLGIIAQNDPIIVAEYAVAGMIAGLFNKYGKIGVVAGFVIGNGILIYVAKGDTSNFAMFKEILVAAIGLLAVPNWVGIDIEELNPKENYFPSFKNNRLSQGEETVNQLNMVSETIKDIADTYELDSTAEEAKKKNKNTFITELLNNLDGLEDNLLYDDISNTKNGIVDEIFEVLRRSNKYIDETMPWSLAKEEDKKDRLETVLYNLLESIRVCANHLTPFLTNTSKEILKQLNTTDTSLEFKENNSYNNMKPEVLFQRIDKEKKLKEIEENK